MSQNKNQFALYVTSSAIDEVEELYTRDNCKAKSEFIEKAILFYASYLHTKLAVESNIGNHILAADTDMDVLTYEKLRGRSVREVQQTNGKISFKDDLIFQKSL